MKADESDVVGDPSGKSGKAAALTQQPIRASAAISADTQQIRRRTYCNMMFYVCMCCAFAAFLLSLQESAFAVPRGHRKYCRGLDYQSSMFSIHYEYCAWVCLNPAPQKGDELRELQKKKGVSIEVNRGGDSMGLRGTIYRKL